MLKICSIKKHNKKHVFLYLYRISKKSLRNFESNGRLSGRSVPAESRPPSRRCHRPRCQCTWDEGSSPKERRGRTFPRGSLPSCDELTLGQWLDQRRDEQRNRRIFINPCRLHHGAQETQPPKIEEEKLSLGKTKTSFRTQTTEPVSPMRIVMPQSYPLSQCASLGGLPFELCRKRTLITWYTVVFHTSNCTDFLQGTSPGRCPG